MATTALIGLLSDSTASPRTTGAIVPTDGALLVAFVVASGTSIGVGTFSTSVGTTFVKATTSAAFGGNAHVIHCFVAEQLSTDVSQTATFDSVGDQTTGNAIFVMEVNGAGDIGLDAIVQATKQDNQSGPATPTLTFGSPVDTNNVTFSCLGVEGSSPTGATQPTGWAVEFDTGWITPTTGAMLVSRDSGFSGTTITWGSSAEIFASMAVEVLAAEEPEPPGSSILLPRHVSGMGGAW